MSVFVISPTANACLVYLLNRKLGFFRGDYLLNRPSSHEAALDDGLFEFIFDVVAMMVEQDFENTSDSTQTQ